MSIELVVFDMAGTTVYDGDAVNRCLQEALVAAGAEVTRDEINGVMGLPKPVAIRDLLVSKSVVSASDVEFKIDAIFADFQKRMIRHYETDPEVRPIAGALDVFHSLNRHGVKVALDTGFSRTIVDTILQRFGWDKLDCIQATVASDEVAAGRPHADLIIRAMELTGVAESGKVAKVGDTPSDLYEGKAAGCSLVIGVTEGSHTREELAVHPHTHLIGTVAELPELLFT